MTLSDVVRWHASTVAFKGHNDWRGLVIIGRSGAGKSELALQLMAMGARLVADDQTEFRLEGQQITATAPDTLRGLIEMRGMGLVHADPVDAVVHTIVDLDQREGERMPPPRSMVLLGQDVPLLHRVDSPAFASGLRQYILGQNTSNAAKDGHD